MTSCTINNLHERDMDMMFMELFAADSGFLKLVADRVPSLTGHNLSVVDITLSKVDANLGESDITVIVQNGDQRFAFLIEDKIDAIAMPEQHTRYKARGANGVKNHEYDAFEIFIFCPQKYYDANSEAKLYEKFVAYEGIHDYLSKQDSPMHKICRQQIEQAISKAKKPVDVQKNENAIDFFLHYRTFQQQYYPKLDIRTKPGANGWWVVYGSHFGNTYLHHKLQEGFVDLTFSNAASKIQLAQLVAEWLRKHGYDNVISVIAGKAAVLRIEVPRLAVLKPFEETPESDLHRCFTVLSDLAEIANIFAIASNLSVLKKS